MLELDIRGVSQDIIGSENGLNIQAEFENYKTQIADIVSDLYKRKDTPGEGLQWMNLGYSQETSWYVKEYAALVENRFDNILVLGIGGSTLGGIAITHALLKPYWNLLSKEQRGGYPRIFFLDNVDPDDINGLLDIIDLKKTLVNVITKSGDTTETMAQYMIIKDRLEKELDDDYRKNIIVTTDKKTGILRQISEQEGYKTFVVPDDVGGRFSVFTAVGLLPFALVGINIDEITAGIRDLDAQLKNTNIYENIAAQNALIHYLLDTKYGKDITVLMPYSEKLKFIPDWFTQLWAESLGKNKTIEEKPIKAGPTPIGAIGARDQHTLMQLFNEGPNNKVINFVRIGEFDTTLDIPQIFQYTGIGYLGGKTVNNLINAEADSTQATLIDYSRPTITIKIPKVDGYHIAQLLYMLEMQTAITGALYNINTFDQPSVEQTRNYTYGLMGRIGYEGSAKALHDKLEYV